MAAKRKLTLTDLELLLLLEQGKPVQEIAKSQRVSVSAVYDRLRILRENLPAPAARRAEETVGHTLDAFSALERSMTRLEELQTACLRLLASTDGAGLDVSPQPLGEGMSGADPRTLLLAAIAQTRQHIELAVKLAERLHDVQEVQHFQEAVIGAIEQADPATAARIRGALHERRTLRLALRPPGPGE